MPPLTLEQVLAQSMRRPSPKQLPGALRKGIVGSTPNSSTPQRPSPPAAPTQPPTLSTATPLHPVRMPSRDDILRGLRRTQREEEQRSVDLFAASRKRREALSHAPHTSAIGSSWRQDAASLTSLLRAALSMHAWEEGIQAFCSAVSSLPSTLVQRLLSTPTVAVTEPVEGPTNTVTATQEQVELLLALCVGAGKVEAVEAIGSFFGRRTPAILLQAVEALLGFEKYQATTAEAPTFQERILEYLAHSGIPANEIPIDVFHVLLTKCEEQKDCCGALYIVQSMGANPLSKIEFTPKQPVNEAKLRQPFSQWALEPVKPNVVSYARLIAAMEQSGESKFASYIVSLLPPAEKSEITASYAALIFLWSQQVLTNHRKKW